MHERNILEAWFRGLDEERSREVRVKTAAMFHFGSEKEKAEGVV